MSYSPGPWKFEALGHRYLISCPTEGWVIRMDASTMAAFHQRGNAQLIAAAPELLESLKIAVRQNSHDMQLTGEELRVCEQAIAKAEGRA